MGADTQAIEKASQDINETRDAVQNALQQLKGQLEPAMAGWQGQAADVFRKLMDRYEENGKKILEKLGQLAENVQSSGKDYAASQEEEASNISKIEGMLGG
ncbi:WXG100 family type VII secretion target [Saccharopolyspora montiporae]|nr:WXG100 family type VII secretion target [Saccharopolyspora sp. HNM0983]